MTSVRYDNGTGMPKDIQVDEIEHWSNSKVWMCTIGTNRLRISERRLISILEDGRVT